MTQALTALAFGLGLPGFFGTLALVAAVTKDGSPFRKDFWR